MCSTAQGRPRLRITDKMHGEQSLIWCHVSLACISSGYFRPYPSVWGRAPLRPPCFLQPVKLLSCFDWKVKFDTCTYKHACIYKNMCTHMYVRTTYTHKFANMYLTSFHPETTHDVTGEAKCHVFDDLLYSAMSPTITVPRFLETKLMHQFSMDRAWDKLKHIKVFGNYQSLWKLCACSRSPKILMTKHQTTGFIFLVQFIFFAS